MTIRAVAVALVGLGLSLAAPRASADPAGPQVLAGLSQQMPHDLTVDGAYVYWTDRAGGGLWRVATKGGAPKQIARDLAEPRAVVAGGGGVFVATDHGVIRIDEKRLTPRAITAGDDTDLAELAIDRRALFVVHRGGSIDRVDLAGLRVTTLTDQVPSPGILAVDGADVIVASTADNGLWRVPRAGGTPRRLAVLPDTPDALAIDGAAIYAHAYHGDDLVAVPRAGGDPTVAIAHVGEVYDLVADGGALWWTDAAGGTISAAGARTRVAHVLFRDQPRVFVVAVDAHGVYWYTTTLGGGPTAILRGPRPALADLDAR